MLAVLASTQELAATVAVRHGPVAGRPVRGSTMWWYSPRAVCQRRTVVLEVASPPAAERDGRPRLVEGAAVVVGDTHGPAAFERLARNGDVASE